MRLPFIDRERERARLSAALRRKESTLACLYGRRRCGKSRLLLEVIRSQQAVYYVGDARGAPLQRRSLSREIARLLPGFDRVEYPGWDALLERWWTDAPAGGVLALDELPALVDASPELPSLLQKWIDTQTARPRHTILCGSSQRMMRGVLLNAAAPLFGRAREIVKVEPMGLAELHIAMKSATPIETVESFALWGGIPRYWELALELGSRETALRHLVLDPMGVLHREPERLLQDDMRDVAQASSILSVIGQGVHRISEIGARLGVPATSLSRPLARLVDLGLVTREIPFGTPERDSKKSLYRIADPLLRFWYRFIDPNRSRLEAGQIQLVMEDVRRDWPGHLGAIWEDLARMSVARLPLDGRRWLPAARWWGTSREGERIEIDILSACGGEREHFLVGEAKLGATAKDVPWLLAALEAKAKVCPATRGKRVSTMLWLMRKPAGPSDPRVIGAADLLTCSSHPEGYLHPG